MKKPKYSIVIPVYQTKEYLTKCIDSVLAQSYTDFELILIDDGSSDGSSNICDKYKNIDNRIIVKHKNNEGQGQARNDGIQISNGEYIIFIDSDDWWDDRNALSKINNLTQNVDVVFFELKSVISGKIIYQNMLNKLKNEYNSGKELIKDLLKNNPSFSWYPVIYAFKKEIWNKNNISFPKGTYFEDTATVYKIILNANKIKVLKESFYCYRQERESSTTKKITKKLLLNHLDVCKNCISSIKTIEENDYDLFLLLANNFACSYIDIMNHLQLLKKSDYQEVEKEMQKNINITKYIIYGKQKYMVKIIKLLGIKTSATIFGIIKKIKQIIIYNL